MSTEQQASLPGPDTNLCADSLLFCYCVQSYVATFVSNDIIALLVLFDVVLCSCYGASYNPLAYTCGHFHTGLYCDAADATQALFGGLALQSFPLVKSVNITMRLFVGR
jgi:hypothetical protein